MAIDEGFDHLLLYATPEQRRVAQTALIGKLHNAINSGRAL